MAAFFLSVERQENSKGLVKTDWSAATFGTTTMQYRPTGTDVILGPRPSEVR